MSVGPIAGPSSNSYYLPVQPVPPVVRSQIGAPPAVAEAQSPQPDPVRRAPPEGSGRLLDIRV